MTADDLNAAFEDLGFAIAYIAWVPGEGWLVHLKDGSDVIGADKDLLLQNARIKRWMPA